MPKLSKWMEENIPESLTVFSFPCEHGRRIRTSNIVERLNREIHRRIRTIGIFPHEASCERLVTAIVIGEMTLNVEKKVPGGRSGGETRASEASSYYAP